MTSEEAAQLKDYMSAVVNEGTGSVILPDVPTRQQANRHCAVQYDRKRTEPFLVHRLQQCRRSRTELSSQSSQKVPTGALAEALYQLQEISLIHIMID